MHGSIFVLLKDFVVKIYNEPMWYDLLKNAGVVHIGYEERASYPDEEMNAILSAASYKTGLASSDLQEKFGEFIAPHLMNRYKSYLRPEWKTFEVLEFTEPIMHTAARSQDEAMSPPVLNTDRVSNTLIIIDYYSKRRMGSLAIGIIRGIARYFGEEDTISVVSKTESNAERVQIRVERIQNHMEL
jgi:hypothetical protein